MWMGEEVLHICFTTQFGKASALSGRENGLCLECGIPYWWTQVWIFFKNLKFTVDPEKDEIRTGRKQISFLSAGIQHRKRTFFGNADVLSRRPESRAANLDEKFEMETDISVKVLAIITEDRWSSSEIQKSQLEYLHIRPILKKKLNSVDRRSWQEIARESAAPEQH
ncbi:hypothetical protein AVEN_129468-1 [Araneus ventricosus]|uniref:Uncharacterized protein n=1 Tax=Araneus ventricosus TaxID=182803 RepID=A0A4Y2MBE3_ARAVE|nr:hypothetical protein AVEN_129468-1 [Araneus ventricosus]